MLCRSKLLLEKLVIKKGSVLEGDADQDKAGGGMTAADLLSLLKQPVNAKSDVAQSGVVDDKVDSSTALASHITITEANLQPATQQSILWQCATST
jgi:hypothetical protein